MADYEKGAAQREMPGILRFLAELYRSYLAKAG
jgi:hypothetical protein